MTDTHPQKIQSEWLNRKEAAIYLAKIGCPVSGRTLDTLAQNNNEGGGPSFVRIRKKFVRYNRSDLEAWAKKVTVRIE